MFPHFDNGEGALKDELSNDRLHLMSDGYKKWVEILTPYMEKLAS